MERSQTSRKACRNSVKLLPICTYVSMYVYLHVCMKHLQCDYAKFELTEHKFEMTVSELDLLK